MDSIINRVGEIGLITIAILISASVSAKEGPEFSFEAGVEYDDNISVPVLDLTTGESDVAAILEFSASYAPIQEAGREIELAYDFYQSLHETLDDFDLQIHTLSALGSWEIGEFDTGFTYYYSRIYLGGSDLYDSHTLTPSLGFSGLQNWYHLVSYAYQDKNFFSASGRDAKQHSVGLENYYLFMDNKAHVVLKLRAEDEDAKDAELDYQGVTLELGVSAPLTDGDRALELKASYRHYWRDYDNITASIGQKRDDEQDFISIYLIKPVYKDISVKVSYEYTNAESDLPSADYSGNVALLSFLMDF